VLPVIDVPTLVMHHTGDPVVPIARGRYLADHIPGARFVGYDSGGHLLVGHEAESTAEILAFLRANR
jgi:pimeloyl-ACP methyl ester carboxylesterase